MRITSSLLSDVVNQPPADVNADATTRVPGGSPTAGRRGDPSIQFGTSVASALLAKSGQAALSIGMLPGIAVGTSVPPGVATPTPLIAPPADADTPLSTSESATADDTADSSASFLDASKYSSAKDLARWAPLVANLPPEQREQAEKELNRPIAAARMAADGGADAEKAMQFINDNPALKNAVDTGKHGGKADGKITSGDLKAFASKMQSSADKADRDLNQFIKKNPGADPQSLEMVRSASMLQANAPLAKAADPNQQVGGQNPGKVDKFIRADGIKALAEGNPGLAGPLRDSAKTWSQPGFSALLDQGGLSGRDLAGHSPDKKFDSVNISNWIKKQAPTNGGEFASMLSDAATINAVADVDISKLDKQVFENPSAFSGAQKAAVMVKLQQTQQSVVAGRDLRKTEKTEAALNDRIGQLQADPDVSAFMDQSLPRQEKALVASDPSLQQAVIKQFKQVNSGQALAGDMATADRAISKKSPIPDYSGAISGLSAQLQLQKDLLGSDAETPGAVNEVPSASDVVNRAGVQPALKQSYLENFAQGSSLKQMLAPKKANAEAAFQTVVNQKQIYDSVLPEPFVKSLQPSVAQSTLKQLGDSKAGRKLVDQPAANTASSAFTQFALAQLSPDALGAIQGYSSATDSYQRGDKLDAAKNAYDSTKSGASAARKGYDAAAKLIGREPSAGLGRMAASVGTRVAGMVAGEAAGAAAGMALGASIPVVGWVIDAAASLGFGIAAIIAAVKKHNAQKAFDHNVDPTLEQFGIPKAH